MSRGCNQRMSARDERMVLGASLFTIALSLITIIAR